MPNEHEPLPQDQPDLTPGRLCDADAAALDAILDARRMGSETGPMPPGLSDRSPKVRSLMALLDQCPASCAEADEPCIEATLAAVNQARQRERFAQQVQMMSTPPRTLGLSLRQAISAAAIVLIGASLLLPVLSRSREVAQRTACAGNLSLFSRAVSGYATDNLGHLPRYDVTPGMRWLDFGDGAFGDRTPTRSAPVRSNSAHLFILVYDGYLSLDSLACPSLDTAQRGQLRAGQLDWRHPAEVSYSYQNQYSDEPIVLSDNPGLAILADKNPIFVPHPSGKRLMQHHDVSLNAPSPTHGQKGQNVTFANGSVAWMTSPETPGINGNEMDNIWTIRGVSRYTGTEALARPAFDSFLAP